MTIRTKIIFIVFPLIVTPLILTAIVSALSARNGITLVATEFLRFKAEELRSYAETQWSLLEKNGLTDDPNLVQASKRAVESFAKSLIRRDTELILGFDQSANVVMRTAETNIEQSEAEAVSRFMSRNPEGWLRIRIGKQRRVAQASTIPAFGWFIMVTELEDTFYQTINQMFWQIGFILSVSLLVSIILLLGFSYYLTKPLRNVIGAMRGIISTSDLTNRVEIMYNDETGELGHTFNLMTDELDNAYKQIKTYAIKTAIAQTKEQRIRNIFQKYVPHDVIEQYFINPESMLKGEDRPLAVLFSDIRGFTAISEKLQPQEVVDSLNHYFALMVDVIMGHQGIVDKYIGDALMAFFGAPVRHDDDALQAVLSGFEMMEKLGSFNQWQLKQGRPEFKIGIGINFGTVTVGNIGSEKKMDYTVVGDMVNVASRIEGLCKMYREPFIISQHVYSLVGGEVQCRMIDRVILKGTTRSMGIYTPRRELTGKESEAWKLHNAGLKLYYDRNFTEALASFQKVQELLPGDPSSQVFIDRCTIYKDIELPDDWDGSVVMSEK